MSDTVYFIIKVSSGVLGTERPRLMNRYVLDTVLYFSYLRLGVLCNTERFLN